MGPVFPYESGNAYEARNLPAIPSTHCYYRSSKDKPAMKQVPNCGMAAKLATDASITADNNPFYTTRAAAIRDDRVHERAVVEANKATYGGIGVAAAAAANANVAAHRKVGSVQYGMARMY